MPRLNRLPSDSQPGPLAANDNARPKLYSFYVNYDWNVAGDLTGIRENGATSGAGLLATFAYDNLGRRTSLTRGNTTTSTYTFSNAGQLATLALDPVSSGYDQTWTYTRNLAGQIVDKAWTNSAYDPPTPSAVLRGYASNDVNQMTAASIYNLTFDTNGNLSADAAGTYGYDIANRLTSYNSGAVTLGYDPLSRLYETAGGSTTRFAYDGADMIGEYNTSGTLLRRYVHGPNDDEPLVWYEGTGTSDRRWLMADDLGSIVAVTNGSGVATATVGFAEFGEASPVARFGFTGQAYIPEIGLYHYKARTYSPSLGRFLQPDPTGYADGMNIYAYVKNDPVNHRDSSGLQTDGTSVSDVVIPANCPVIEGMSMCIYTADAMCALAWVPSYMCEKPDGLPERASEHEQSAPNAGNGAGVGLPIFMAATIPFTSKPRSFGDCAAAPGANRFVNAAQRAYNQYPPRMRDSIFPFSLLRGIAIHQTFATSVRAMGYPYDAEVSYKDGLVVRYGTPGSVRADGVYGSNVDPIYVIELKSGLANISLKEFLAYEENLPRGTLICVITEAVR